MATAKEIDDLLETLRRHGFETPDTGRTISVRRKRVEYGYIKPDVRSHGVMGYHLAPLDIDGQQCPIANASTLVRGFCDRHRCDSSKVHFHSLGPAKGKGLLIIKDPQVALLALLHDSGVQPYDRTQVTSPTEAARGTSQPVTAPRRQTVVQSATQAETTAEPAVGSDRANDVTAILSNQTTSQSDKQARLGELFQRVYECRLCPRVFPSLVPRVSSGCDARLALMAQAPGESGVRKTGLQWRGLGGRLRDGGRFLEKHLRTVGYSVDPQAQDYPRPYTTNAVHCWPGPRPRDDRDRRPRATEVTACRQWWQEELRVVRPSVLVLLGEVSADALTNACGLSLSFSDFVAEIGLTCDLNGLILQCFALPHPVAPYRERRAPYRGRAELYDEAFSVIGRLLKEHKR